MTLAPFTSMGSTPWKPLPLRTLCSVHWCECGHVSPLNHLAVSSTAAKVVVVYGANGTGSHDTILIPPEKEKTFCQSPHFWVL